MKTKGSIIKSTKNIFYKTNPYGISLIVLVITIIVIIILATAIILTLSKNNPIEEANKARYESDRDSIQSIFTNTVVKVMAKNQGTIEVEEGIINSIKSGVSSTIGEVIYKIENPEKSENKEGKIIFENGTNTEVEYYTGRKLPIYKAGETIWSVDREGVINLKVGKNDISEEENNENNSGNIDGNGISKEEYNNLVKEISEMKTIIQSQNITIQNQDIKIDRLENETILNKRELLSNKNTDIPLTTSWVDGNFADITLSNSVKDYKYIEVNFEVVGSDSSKYYEKTEFLSINNLNYNNSNNHNWHDGSIFFLMCHSGSSYYHIGGWLKNDKTLHIGCAKTCDNRNKYSLRIKNIYGIK